MATSSGSYLDALSTAASQTSGAGIITYVELPITAALAGGAGINTYASNLVSSSTDKRIITFTTHTKHSLNLISQMAECREA